MYVKCSNDIRISAKEIAELVWTKVGKEISESYSTVVPIIW